MRMNGKELTVLLDTVVLAVGILAGYGNSAPETVAAGTAAPAIEAGADAGSSAASGDIRDIEATEAEGVSSVDLSGTTSVVGPTSMEKFVNTLSESFIEEYPGMTVTAEFAEPGAGVEAVSNGTADTGNSSRDLKGEEKADGVAENIVAIDRITVVVGAANTVEGLTKQQLSDIYEGKITNWKDVGGNDTPIVMVGRESGSDTKSAFEGLLELENVCKYSNKLDSTGAVIARMAFTPGATGYISLDVLDDTARAMKLEGAEPTGENIKAGSYFLSHPFVMATEGGISERSDLVKALFDYIYSKEGVEIVKSMGLIAVDK